MASKKKASDEKVVKKTEDELEWLKKHDPKAEGETVEEEVFQPIKTKKKRSIRQILRDKTKKTINFIKKNIKKLPGLIFILLILFLAYLYYGEVEVREDEIVFQKTTTTTIYSEKKILTTTLSVTTTTTTTSSTSSSSTSSSSSSSTSETTVVTFGVMCWEVEIPSKDNCAHADCMTKGERCKYLTGNMAVGGRCGCR